MDKEDGCCDFCAFYAFNGNEHGAYMNLGRCEHPSHPRDSDPGDWCEDFAFDPTPSVTVDD